MEMGQESHSADSDSIRLSDFLGPAAAILAVALFFWQASRSYGWLEAVFGGLATLFWAGVVLWLVASIFAINARQHWWVIASAPFALYPIAMAALLVVACARGNCL